MREISEYTLLGNYLVIVSDKLGQDSIKYEVAKSLTEKVMASVNKNSQNYILLPMDSKKNIVQKMIGKGVFRTNSSNRAITFKQVFNYEIAKNINAYYSCDGNLVFKLPKTSYDEKDRTYTLIKSSYCDNLNLDLRNAINNAMVDIKTINKPKSKSKE